MPMGGMKVLLAGLLICIALGVTVTVSSAQTQNTIPNYIRQHIMSWVEGDVDDRSLVAVIQFMIETSIIEIPQIELLKSENQDLENQVLAYERAIQGMMQEASDELTISVHTNKLEYTPGDSIMIFGFVSYLVPNHEVGIVISDSSGTILAIAQIPPNVDGSYGFVASDPIFRESGEYDVHVYYGGQAYSNTSYLYRPVR